MAVTLTSSYQQIAQTTTKWERWQEGWSDTTKFQCRQTLYAKYVSRSNTSATIRVKIYLDNVWNFETSSYDTFDGIWCNPNYGGYFKLGCYNSSSCSSCWQWVTRQDWSNHSDWNWYYEQDFTVSCDYGAWSGSVGHCGVYPYCNMTESNSLLTGSVNLASLITAPSTPSVTVNSRSTNGANFSVSVSSMGNPSDLSGRYVEAAILSQNTSYSDNATRRYTTGTQGNDSATVDVTSSSASGGTLNIVSNTQYYYGGYASNTKANISTIPGQLWTLPEAPTASNFQSLTTTTASFSVVETSVGTGRTVQLRYRYKESSASSYGSWINAGSAGNNQTETVTLTSLTPGSNYDIQVSSLADTDESGITTYLNAFQTVGCSCEITGYEFSTLVLDNSVVCVPTTFNCSMSGATSASDTYTLTLTCTAGSVVKTKTETVTGDYLTKNMVINLPANTDASTQYSVVLGIRLNDSTNSYTLANGVAVPKSRPNSPTIEALPAYDTLKKTLTMSASPSLLGQVQTFSSMTFNAYKVDTNSVETLIQTYTTSTNALTSFTVDKAAIDPNIYPNIKIYIYQTNTVGVSSLSTTATTTNLNKIIGKIILPTGTKRNVVRVRVKKSDGTLTDGNYEHPLVIVEPS